MFKTSILGSIAIVLMAIILIAEAEASSDSDERIFGGHKAALGQFPHQVSLRRIVNANLLEHFCGGVLINDHTILSTANCTQGIHLQPKSVSIVVGTVNVQLYSNQARLTP